MVPGGQGPEWGKGDGGWKGEKGKGRKGGKKGKGRAPDDPPPFNPPPYNPNPGAPPAQLPPSQGTAPISFSLGTGSKGLPQSMAKSAGIFSENSDEDDAYEPVAFTPNLPPPTDTPQAHPPPYSQPPPGTQPFLGAPPALGGQFLAPPPMTSSLPIPPMSAPFPMPPMSAPVHLPPPFDPTVSLPAPQGAPPFPFPPPKSSSSFPPPTGTEDVKPRRMSSPRKKERGDDRKQKGKGRSWTGEVPANLPTTSLSSLPANPEGDMLAMVRNAAKKRRSEPVVPDVADQAAFMALLQSSPAPVPPTSGAKTVEAPQGKGSLEDDPEEMRAKRALSELIAIERAQKMAMRGPSQTPVAPPAVPPAKTPDLDPSLLVSMGLPPDMLANLPKPPMAKAGVAALPPSSVSGLQPPPPFPFDMNMLSAIPGVTPELLLQLQQQQH